MDMIFILGTALGASLMLVPLVRWLSFRTGRVSKPRQDRWHRQPTPTLGGMGMFIAFWLALGLALALGYQLPHWSLLAGSMLMFSLGLVDDFKRLPPAAKLIGQLVAAAIVVFFGGFTINFFPWPFANLLLTLFWLIGITNATNLLDNMDGLAGGVSLIAACFLGYFFWKLNDTSLLVMVLALAGSILGFLVFNFPPAKIFMGDCGSLFLGFTLAGLAIARNAQASNVFAVLGIPVLIFMLPILDTSLVMITRLLRGQSPSQGGTDHTSHRLIALGLSERQVVLILYAVAIVAGLSAAALEALDYDLSLGLIPLVLLALLILTAYLAQLKVVNKSGESGVPLGFTRLLVNLTYRRNLFELLLDLLLVGTSYYLAYWVRFGMDMTPTSVALYLASWPVSLIAAYLSFFLLGVYRSVWHYTSLVDLARFALASLAAGVASWLFLILIPFEDRVYPDAVFGLFALFLFLGLAGSRASFAFLDRFYQGRQLRSIGQPILVYGVRSPSLGIILAWLQEQNRTSVFPVGLLDEDQRLWGRDIEGIPVLGGVERIPSIVEAKAVRGVVITDLGAPDEETIQKITDLCRTRGVWVKLIRIDLTDVVE